MISIFSSHGLTGAFKFMTPDGWLQATHGGELPKELAEARYRSPSAFHFKRIKLKPVGNFSLKPTSGPNFFARFAAHPF
jgi:hypothetical protein